jgi:general secretion pathway protein D
VIGGLLEKRTIESTDKIPLLGDIPLLGRVFSNVRSEEKETNLWVIITPYLIEKRGGGKGE